MSRQAAPRDVSGVSAGTKGLLSVIVPVYNAEPWLRQCLESLCGQSYRKLEIICVDDGSTDGSAAILQEYAAKDSRIRVLSQPNGGVSAARNAGLDAATGEWVTGVDPDDYLLPHAYRTAMAHAKDGVDLVVFGVQVEAEPGSGREGELAGMRGYMNTPHRGIHPLDAAHICDFGVFVNKLYRRALIEEHHLRFDTQLHTSEDVCFHMCYCAYAGKAHFLPEPLYVYILHKGTLSAKDRNSEGKYADCLRYLENVLSLYTGLGLAGAYERMFAALLLSVDDILTRWGYFTAKALTWRKGLLKLAVTYRLQELAATAPVLHEFREQLCCAERALALLRSCAAAPTPPAEGDSLHIAIPVDETHAGRALLLAQSLRQTAEAGRAVCVHFIGSGVSPYTRACLEAAAGENLLIRIHEPEARLLRHLPALGATFPHATWLKMALPWLLPELEQVLVLTPGLLVKGTLPPPPSAEMGGMPVAVPELFPVENREAQRRRVNVEKYVSPAAVLMDLARLREENAMESWVVACMFQPHGGATAEADSFNRAFQGRMAALPSAWEACLQQASEEEWMQAALEPTFPESGSLPLAVDRAASWTLHLPRGRRVEDLALRRNALRWRYLCYSLLAKLPLGRKKRLYAAKRRTYRDALKQVRHLLRECRRAWGL